MPKATHAAAVGREVRLGKRSVKPDARNLQLARYVDDDELLPKVPRSIEWSAGVASWPMYANDRLGDCTCAAVAHMEEAWSANAGRAETPVEHEVIDLYWATGPEDDGRYCLDILNYWQKTGFRKERIRAFVQIDPHKREHVALACWMFGGVYVGLALPLSAQAQTDEWKVSHGSKAERGSWGGHCVNLVDYLSHGPVCVTWGRLMPMTWAFLETYCDEAYAVISPDWVDDGRAAPSGFALAQLEQDLAAIESRRRLVHA